MRMQGWKTWAAGIALILSGLGSILGSFDWDTFSFGDGLNAGILMIGNGLGLIGIGHKVEKAATTITNQ